MFPARIMVWVYADNHSSLERDANVPQCSPKFAVDLQQYLLCYGTDFIWIHKCSGIYYLKLEINTQPVILVDQFECNFQLWKQAKNGCKIVVTLTAKLFKYDNNFHNSWADLNNLKTNNNKITIQKYFCPRLDHER